MRRISILSLMLVAATALSAQTYRVIYQFGEVMGPNYLGQITQTRGGAMLLSAGNVNEGDYPEVSVRIWPTGGLQVFTESPVGVSRDYLLGTDGKVYGANGEYGLYTDSLATPDDGIITTISYLPSAGSDQCPPWPGPIQSVRGDFYGTTGAARDSNNGPYGYVYKVTEEGGLTLLHAFTGTDGSNPSAQLVQATNYYFYGATERGGQYDKGTIFRVSRTGDFKVLVNFNRTNGDHPVGLIQANDGNFYGVTLHGGSSNHGVLFRMTPGGALTVLHNFTPDVEGASPVALLQASDGNLYGAASAATEPQSCSPWSDTAQSAAKQSGQFTSSAAIFRATLAGKVTVLHRGGDPKSLFQHTNGKLYGATTGEFFSLDAGLRPFVTYLPTYGRAGALVQILGQGFTSTSQVYFNGKLAAAPTVVSPTYLRVIVPSGPTTGPIIVTTGTGKLTSNKVFIVHQN